MLIRIENIGTELLAEKSIVELNELEVKIVGIFSVDQTS